VKPHQLSSKESQLLRENRICSIQFSRGATCQASFVDSFHPIGRYWRSRSVPAFRYFGYSEKRRNLGKLNKIMVFVEENSYKTFPFRHKKPAQKTENSSTKESQFFCMFLTLTPQRL